MSRAFKPTRSYPRPSKGRPLRHLVIVLGDQLDSHASALDGFDPSCDAVWMAEVADESTHVWSHKARIVVFLSAMRHFCLELRRRGFTVHYRALDDSAVCSSLSAELTEAVEQLRPAGLIMTEAGDARVRSLLNETARALGIPLEVRSDRHFLCTREEFADHAASRQQLRQEYFYRWMRRRTGILMAEGQPAGGAWNFDKDNRERFGPDGPVALPAPRSFTPDAVTREVIALVATRFASHPGSLEGFDWPVTRHAAQEALEDFVAHRLSRFGPYQDAMWTDEPFLYHSCLSSAMNLKLLDPRDVLAVAEDAYRSQVVPLNSAEGFIRQILGWREYVRGVYDRFMPAYIERNALEADGALPGFYWGGEVRMRCLAEAIGQTLQYGYAHHIQRLMVTGLYALLLGVHPRRVHEWYLAVYVDAVEWVELPNTLGMSQFADGGVMASKPYVASGKYIQRMSNYCEACPFDPGEATGERACPFTTLYWDFLLRHEKRLRGNPRMRMQMRNLGRLDRGRRRLIGEEAGRWKQGADG